VRVKFKVGDRVIAKRGAFIDDVGTIVAVDPTKFHKYVVEFPPTAGEANPTRTFCAAELKVASTP
jgi:hypothetical protein